MPNLLSDRYTITAPRIGRARNDHGLNALIASDPPCPKAFLNSDWELVVPRSPIKLRKSLEQIAYYFKREGRYDFVQYEFDEGELEPRDRIFAYVSNEDCDPKLMGGAVFRWRKWNDAEHGIALAWVWLHPYIRGNGVLSEVWPLWRKWFGSFFVEPPLSHAMIRFLASRNECFKCGTECRCKPQSEVDAVATKTEGGAA
jgi:RimJ/RimL family protein N-acetyltransferase